MISSSLASGTAGSGSGSAIGAGEGSGADQGGVSGPLETGGADTEGGRGREGVPVSSGLVLLSDSAKAQLQQRGVTVVDLQDQSADVAAFSAALDAARAADQAHGWAALPTGRDGSEDAGSEQAEAANGREACERNQGQRSGLQH